MVSDGPLVIPETRVDPVYRRVSSVESLRVAAYLGIPLRLPGGLVLGSLCAIDVRPHAWTEREIGGLSDVAAAVMTEIELRQEIAERARGEAALSFLARSGSVLASSLDYRATLRVVAQLAVPVADHCAMDLVEGEKLDRVEVALAARTPRAVRERVKAFRPDQNSSHPAAVAIRTGKLVLVAEVTDEWLTNHSASPTYLRSARTGGPVDLVRSSRPAWPNTGRHHPGARRADFPETVYEDDRRECLAFLAERLSREVPVTGIAAKGAEPMLPAVAA